MITLAELHIGSILKKPQPVDLSSLTPEDYEILVGYIASIRHNYLALRNSLDDQLKQPTLSDVLAQKICEAHELAQVLINCYKRYLQLPAQSNTYSTDLVMYDRLLVEIAKIADDNVDEPVKTQMPRRFLIQYIESNLPHPESNAAWTWVAATWLLWSQSLNLIRLLIGRLRNLFRFLCLVIAAGSTYVSCFGVIDAYVGPFLGHLGWVFFLPRLIIEGAKKTYHVFFPYGPEEKSLKWYTRLAVHVKENWFDLMVWMSWCICGLVVCFVLFSNPIAIGFLLFSVQASELFINIMRSYIEYQRFHDLNSIYTGTDTAEANSDISTHLEYLKQRRQAEYIDLFYNVISNGLFLLAVGLMMPAIALFCPALPIIGAVLSVLVTLACIYYIKIHRPAQLHNPFAESIPSDVAVLQEIPAQTAISLVGARHFSAEALNADDQTTPQAPSPKTVARSSSWLSNSSVSNKSASNEHNRSSAPSPCNILPPSTHLSGLFVFDDDCPINYQAVLC